MYWMNYISLSRILCTFCGIVFLISGLLINLIQFSLLVLLKPFSGYLFRKLNYYLSYSLYSQIVFLVQYWADIKVTMSVNKDDYDNLFGKEHAFLLMNHSYEIDWMIGWILCDNCHVLGNVKTYAKKSLQYLPTLGYSWKMGGSIFVERNWEKDQKLFETKLRDLVSYEEPIWLLLAAEGTRFTKEKHEASKIFAKEHGLPELRYHLTPRTKGFTSSIPIIRKKINVIYDINLGIKPDGVRPTLTNILLGKSINADLFAQRVPLEDLPESESELAAWLHSFYKLKDDLHHSYITTGNWMKTPYVKEYVSFQLKRRLFPAINFALWFVAIVVPLGFLIVKILLSGNMFGIGSVLGILASFVYLLNKLVGETQISKASSYGTAKNANNHSKLKN